MPRKYRLLKDYEWANQSHKAGDIVYALVQADYGCARDDTIEEGEPFLSVTRDSGGEYPGFTLPLRVLEVVS